MKRTLKRITIALSLCALLLSAGCVTAIAESQEDLPTAKYVSAFLEVDDLDVPTVIVRIAEDMERKQAEEEAAREAEAAAEAAYEEEWYTESQEWYSEPYSGSGSSDGFMQQGVRDGVDSDTETWYSSNALYHYRTSEWTPDDEGYYRDAEGYYVVASDDYPEGSVVTTSKGEAKVYDSGTDSGNIDMYVNW